MSKRSGKRRVTNSNANRRLPLSGDDRYELSPYDRSRQMSFDFGSALRALEDRRTWHPEGPDRPFRSYKSSLHRLVVGPVSPPRRRASRLSRTRDFQREAFSTVPARIGFERPRSVAVCVRRQQRKEVMFATRKAGRSGQKKPRWNHASRISCARKRR